MTTERDADDYLTKAQESLASAEADLEAGRFNSCMNRCYFACFQAAVSALTREGIIAAQGRHEHDDIQRLFNQTFIRRRKVLPQSLASVLRDLIAQRHQADYRPAGISRRAAIQAFSTTKNYVSTIGERFPRS